ncbi:MAG: SRPBCC family protein [Pseudomonadota bacterium]
MMQASKSHNRFAWWPHTAAAAAALVLGAWLSGTPLVQTGVQFVAPAAVILGVHLFGLWRANAWTPGFAVRAFTRSAWTALGLLAAMLMGTLVLPTPAEADVGEVITAIFTVSFCVAVLVLVGLVIFAVASLVFKGISAGARALRKDDDDLDTRFFDFGALAVTAVVMLASALEGLPQTYTFPKADRAHVTLNIAAPADRVWQTMETATTPSVPLPAILAAFPKPVDVAVDEGTRLGARREVAFSGREGAGRLRLAVTDRSAARVHFTVVSDTSPYAQWISFRGLTYQVDPAPGGTALTVSLAYDRDLSPAWFFGPVMRGAGYFAVRVLARDVKARAEG